MDRVYRIVVGYDYSALADRALLTAFGLASRQDEAEVHVVHVNVPQPIVLSPPASGVAIGLALPPDNLDDLTRRIRTAVVPWQRQTHRSFARLGVHTREGSPARELSQVCGDLQANLLVVGTHGRSGLRRFLLGSVAEASVRSAPCPVLVIKDPVEMMTVAEIEPPCPQCLEARRTSEGKELWCSQHSEKHGPRHTYHYVSRVGGPSNAPLVVDESRN